MKFSLQRILDFVYSNCDVKGKRVLEVGCGEGDLAYELQKDGAIMTAVDIDTEVAEIARRKGIKVVNRGFIEIKNEFDVLLFTRSLHHIENLEKAVKHSYEIVLKKGIIILDEFDYENINAPTAEWFYKTLAHLQELNILNSRIDLLDNSLDQWMELHNHEPKLNTGNEMTRQVKAFFSKISKQKVPYLFRYIEDLVLQNATTELLIKKIYEQEKELIEIGRILPLGLRIIGHRN